MYYFLKDSKHNLGVKITCSQEAEPLGTAGPLALDRDKYVFRSGEPFFVLNCDITILPSSWDFTRATVVKLQSWSQR